MRPPRPRDLAPLGPLGTLDRAIDLARAGGAAVVLPAMAGGAILALMGLLVFYVERVEGITSLRLPLALGLVLAWWARAYLVGRAARRVARGLWDAEDEPGAGDPLTAVRTASAVGVGLWLWAWLLALGSLGGWLGVVLVLPLFALRGAVAPSWIARSACAPRGGWRAFSDAVGDHSDRRIEGVLTEALILAGWLGLAVNLYVAALVTVMLLRSFGGLELAAVESFLSQSNTFVLLAVAGLTFVIFEPLRAAHSAVSYVGARVRAEGLDLRAGLEDAIRHAKGRARDRAVRAAAALVAVTLALGAATTEAQDVPPPPAFEEQSSFEEPYEPPPAFDPDLAPADLMPVDDPGQASSFELPLDPADAELQGSVESILARDEFREFEDRRGAGARDLFQRLLDWLNRRSPEAPDVRPSGLPSVALPGAWAFLVLGGLLLLAVILYLAFTMGARGAKAEAAASPTAGPVDPRERAPRSFLDEAAALAEAGDLRGALRALYLATLVALDRRRWIAFDPHLTNWQYLRQMPRGATRDTFRELTRLFDYKWYGEEETTLGDYERCRALAAEIVEAGRTP